MQTSNSRTLRAVERTMVVLVGAKAVTADAARAHTSTKSFMVTRNVILIETGALQAVVLARVFRKISKTNDLSIRSTRLQSFGTPILTPQWMDAQTISTVF